MTISKRAAWLLAVLLSFSLVATACGDDDSEDTTTTEPDSEDTTTTEPGGDDPGTSEPSGDLAALTGDVFATGSSTVGPITSRVQELFNELAPNVDIAVDNPGTGDGFAAFCNGEADISNASRAIKDEEAANCAANDIEYTELLVGIDGLAVMTNEANDAVECVSYADLYALTGPESAGFGSWSDGNEISAELGGAGTLPDAPLEIFGPGEESGTFDTYVEFVVEEWAEERSQDPTTRPDYSPSADDNVIISGIQGSDTSLGWVGFAFAINAEGVKLLAVDNGETGCVDATPETIASGEYGFARPLYIYVDNARAAENEALQAFVDFYVADGLDTAVAEVGYVALTDDAKEETRSTWNG